MAARRALVIDADHRFCEVLRRSLGPFGFEIQVSLDEDEWLHEVETSPPDLVVIAVDHPEAKGFADFAKLKSVAKRVPVALATATLSASEMGIHEKLRVHADVYLDKRTATPEELVERLEPYLRATPGPPAPALAEEVSPPPDFNASDEETWLEGFLREGLDPELAAGLERALGSADRHPTRNHVPAAPASKEVSARIAQLEADLDLTRRELMDARREARSSPFSDEFLSIRQVASRREADIVRLHVELRERDGRIALLKGLIEKLGRRLVPLMRERDLAVERAEDLRSRTENAEAETHRAIAQSEEFRRRLEALLSEAKASIDFEREEHARAREVQDLALADLKAGYVDHLDRTAREHAASMQALQRQQHDELAALKRAHEKTLAQRDERTQATLRDAVARDRAALAAKLEASEREHQKAMAGLHERHEREVSALEHAQQEELARAEKSAREAREFAVAAEEAAWTERLETQRREHASAMALLRKQHQDAIVGLRASMDEAIAERERRLRTAVGDAVSVERTGWQKQLQEAVEKHGHTLAVLQQQHKGELAALRSAHQEALATRERESEAARSREVTQERSRWEEKLEKSHREHEKALAALRNRCGEEVAALRSEDARLLAAKERGHSASLRDAVAKEKARLEEGLEEMRRQHAAELEALRGRHRDQTEATRLEHEKILAEEAQRTPPGDLQKLASANERARELETQLRGATSDLLARDSTLAALQQELAQREGAAASLEAVIRDLGETIESLVDDRAPADLIVLAAQTTLARLSRPGKKNRVDRH